MYSTKHIANLFDVSRETVRTWSKEFAEYLSDGAKPVDGRHRSFTDDDIRVFALVSDMKAKGLLFADVHMSLKNGQRADPPEGANALARAGDQRKIELLQEQVTALQTQLNTVQQENATKTGMIQILKEQMEQMREEIKRLNREIGRLGG